MFGGGWAAASCGPAWGSSGWGSSWLPEDFRPKRRRKRQQPPASRCHGDSSASAGASPPSSAPLLPTEKDGGRGRHRQLPQARLPTAVCAFAGGWAAHVLCSTSTASFLFAVPPLCFASSGLAGLVRAGVPASHNFVRVAADRIAPAVVRIDTRRPEDLERGVLGYFFGDALHAPSKAQEGQGSGVVVDGTRGLILTSAHLVPPVNGRARVTLTCGRVLEAEVAGRDVHTDLAVLRVPLNKGEHLPQARWREDAEGDAQVGEWVIAVGHPVGLGGTVTLGIVSSTSRTPAEIGMRGSGGARVGAYLQTDCAINPGSSGGPLVDVRGRVVAVAAAIRADAEGVAFAIPARTARRVANTLAEGRPLLHPYLGMHLEAVSPEMARSFDADPQIQRDNSFHHESGLIALKVEFGSPAWEAGVREGDVVTRLGGEKVRTVSHLLDYLLHRVRPGEPLALRLHRRHQTGTNSAQTHMPNPANNDTTRTNTDMEVSVVPGILRARDEEAHPQRDNTSDGRFQATLRHSGLQSGYMARGYPPTAV